VTGYVKALIHSEDGSYVAERSILRAAAPYFRMPLAYPFAVTPDPSPAYLTPNAVDLRLVRLTQDTAYYVAPGWSERALRRYLSVPDPHDHVGFIRRIAGDILHGVM